MNVFLRLRIALVLCTGNALITMGHGETLFQHAGSNDPVGIEGWSLDSPGPGVLTGPINDAGTAAWFVDDNSTGGGSTLIYFRFPSVVQTAAANTDGWQLIVNLRVVDIPDSPLGAPYAAYLSGSRYFAMLFGSQEDGDPIVHLPTQAGSPVAGPSFVLEGSGGGYHAYRLSYDPLQNSADLFVDGVERISNFAGVPIAVTASVGWGVGGLDSGQGNFSLVEFAVVPEPSTILLAFVAFNSTFARYRR